MTLIAMGAYTFDDKKIFLTQPLRNWQVVYKIKSYLHLQKEPFAPTENIFCDGPNFYYLKKTSHCTLVLVSTEYYATEKREGMFEKISQNQLLQKPAVPLAPAKLCFNFPFATWFTSCFCFFPCYSKEARQAITNQPRLKS